MLTYLRIFLAPLFFVFFFMDSVFPELKFVSLVGVWIIFLVMELSDLLDGMVARKYDLVSERGKLLDPFADSFSRLTYFFSFTIAGIMQPWIFLVLLYRDLGVGFIRQLALHKNFTMGARVSGKIKAWVYWFSGFLGLIFISLKKLLILSDKIITIGLYIEIVFILAGLIAIWSLIDYILSLSKLQK